MSAIVNTVIAYNIIRDLTIPFDRTEAFKKGVIDKDGNFLVKQKDMTSEQKKTIPSILTILAWNLKKILSKIGIGRSSIASFAAALYLLREEIGSEDKNRGLEIKLMEYIENNLFKNDRERMINEAFESSLLSSIIESGEYDIQGTFVTVEETLKPFTYVMGIPLYRHITESGKKIVFSKADIEEVSSAPTNNIGGGMIKGASPGEEPPIRLKKRRREYDENSKEFLSRYRIFEVSPEEFSNCKGVKRKFERWDKYLNLETDSGCEIRNFSVRNPHKGIILRNSETGETMVFRRKWEDQRLFHNRKMKMLANSKQEEFQKTWTPWRERVKS
jgi:hypothetical protein